MTFMRVGLPVVLFNSRKVGLPAGAWRGEASVQTSPAALPAGTERR
jgi:hypothetical protein